MWIVVAASALAFAPACGGKKNEEKPAANPAQTGQPPAPGAPNATEPAQRPGMPANARPQTYQTVGPITVDEAKDMMPTPDGARVLKAAAKAEAGERVLAEFCFDQGELPAVAEAVKAKYTTVGWLNVTPRPHRNSDVRLNITGQKAPFMLFGQIERGKYPECDGDAGQTYVRVGVHKMETRTGPPPGVGGPRGPAGMRPVGPRPMAPPVVPRRDQPEPPPEAE